MMAADRLRIVTDGLSGNNARVYLVREGGEQIDISPFVKGAEISVRVGEVNRVSLDLLVHEIDAEGESEVSSLVDRVRQYTGA